MGSNISIPAWLVFSWLLLVAGCIVGPQYQRPQTPAKTQAHYSNLPEGWSEANEPNAFFCWWRSFNDPLIDQLVQRALSANTDILAAVSRVEQASALFEQAQALGLPDVSYQAGRTRTRMSFVLPNITTPMGSFGGRLSTLSTTYSQQISINYLVDLFGRVRRSQRAAMAQVLASQQDAQAVAHAIVAQVVLTRIQIAVAQLMLQIADMNIESLNRSLELTEQRYNAGLASQMELTMARQALVASMASKSLLQQNLGLACNAMDVLCGQPPGQGLQLLGSTPQLPELGPVPTGVPAALLDRRPDVRASELRLSAATEQVGLSIAQLYPDLTLTATGGFMSDTFQDAANLDFAVYSGLIGLAAPIYKGGQLRAAVKAARAAAQEAAYTYAGTVLKAIREVEDALAKHHWLYAQIAQLEQRLALARKAEELARQRYNNGAESILPVFEAQRALHNAENELLVAKGQLWQARVELYLALGGDWALTEEVSDG